MSHYNLYYSHDAIQSTWTKKFALLLHFVKLEYSSVLNRSHVATIRNPYPNYSLPNVTQVSLPKKFQIVATWLQFSTEE